MDVGDKEKGMKNVENLARRGHARVDTSIDIL